MDVIQGLTDDQIAVVGCVLVLIGSALAMSLSYYLGGHHRRQSRHDRGATAAPSPGEAFSPLSGAGDVGSNGPDKAPETRRKAA